MKLEFFCLPDCCVCKFFSPLLVLRNYSSPFSPWSVSVIIKTALMLNRQIKAMNLLPAGSHPEPLCLSYGLRSTIKENCKLISGRVTSITAYFYTAWYHLKK